MPTKQNLETIKKWKKENPEKVKASEKKYRQTHKEKIRIYKKEANKKRRQKHKEWLQTFKQTLHCIKCGETRFYCLDFHHRDPIIKDWGVAQMKAFSKKRVLEEISKCDVLCKNCHTEWHWKNDNLQIKLKEIL